MKRETLSKELIKKAKDLVGFIDNENAAIKLNNKLSGFEAEMFAQDKWDSRHKDILNELISGYNQETKSRLMVREDTTSTSHLLVEILEGNSLLMRYGLKLYDDHKMNSGYIYRVILKYIGINGLRYYQYRNKKPLPVDDIDHDRAEFNMYANIRLEKPHIDNYNL